MTADDMVKLSELLDAKLKPFSEKVESHDRDIRAVKAVIGFLAIVGGMILVIAGGIQGWMSLVK